MMLKENDTKIKHRLRTEAIGDNNGERNLPVPRDDD